MTKEKQLPVGRGARSVGVLANGQVYVPVPRTPADAAAMRGNLSAQLGAVHALDQFYALVGALQADRSVAYDPMAELEAREEERARIKHARAVDQELRDAALYDAKLRHLRAKHQYEAAEEFKDEKFGLGRARFAQRRAEAEVGEAVAREGLREEVILPESASKKAQTLAEQFARMVDDLEAQILKAEAAGESTEGLRSEQELLNKLLRRELLRERS